MTDKKISQMVELTTPVAGDFLPIVDISEVSDADKNKRILWATLTAFEFTSDVLTVVNQDYVLWWDAPFAGTITTVRTKTQSGTCTVTGKIGATPLGGTVNSATSTAEEQAHSSANTFAKGDKILFTASANAAALNLAVVFYGTRT